MQIKQSKDWFKNIGDIEDLLREVKYNSLLSMIKTAQKELNPFNYQLSFQAKKRLQ